MGRTFLDNRAEGQRQDLNRLMFGVFEGEHVALVAMLNDEPEAPGLEAAVAADPVRLMSTAS